MDVPINSCFAGFGATGGAGVAASSKPGLAEVIAVADAEAKKFRREIFTSSPLS
jgi:hypothetical protein